MLVTRQLMDPAWGVPPQFCTVAQLPKTSASARSATTADWTLPLQKSLLLLLPLLLLLLLLLALALLLLVLALLPLVVLTVAAAP